MTRLNPCHSRARGNPWSALSAQKIHAEAQRRRDVSLRPLRLCVNKTFGKLYVQAMDSRVRGNDKIRLGGV